MDALEQFAVTGRVTARAVRSALVPPLAVVALAAFVVPAFAAFALANFSHPLVSPVMLRVALALGGEHALHYPGALVLLPVELAKLGRMTNWLSVTLALGWAGTITAYGPRGLSATAALFATLRRLPRLLVAGVPLVLLHGAAAGMSAQAVADLPRRFVSAAAHLVAAFGLEAAVIAAAMLVLPLAVRSDLGLVRLPGAIRRAFRWAGVAAPAFGAALAAAAVAGRLACGRAAQVMAATRPDGLLPIVSVAALITAIGLVVFAAASVVLAAALDEGWE
jgi:hypothetical protein